ncbi:MAG: Minf_1886 family protein [Planctomycetota bacterium]
MTRIMLDPSHPITELLRRDERYKFDAYVFVWEALRFAQEKLEMGSEFPAAQEEDEPERHVSGQDLCEAMRQYAHEQYGYLAKQVLNHWGVQSTGDFGEIVFNLIEIGKMRKSPQDHREDFDGVFDFEKGFLQGFEFSMPDSSEETR